MPKENKIDAVLIKVTGDNPFVHFVEVDRDNYRVINDLLEIDIMDIVYRRIGSKRYTIVCDDEGLLKDKPVVSAVDKNMKPQLVGNLLICNSTNNGDLKSLSMSDFMYLYQYIGHYFDNGIEIPVLMEVDY